MRDPYREYKRTGRPSDEIAGFGQTILMGLLVLALIFVLMAFGKLAIDTVSGSNGSSQDLPVAHCSKAQLAHNTCNP